MPVNNTAETVAIRLIIKGKVQKVGMRHWIKEQAISSNLGGWVRNKSNGSVEAVLSGNANDVGKVVKLCYRGPTFAEVKQVEELPESEGSEVPREFTILPTV